MKRNKIIAVAGIVLAVIITVTIAGIMTRGKKQEGYVFDRNSKIRMKDVRIYLGQSEFKADDAKDYFKKDVINPYTLKYFFFLDDKFKDSRNTEELLQSVREYLDTIMPSDEADKLFAVYKTYVYYQRDVHDKMTTWGRPSTPRRGDRLSPQAAGLPAEGIRRRECRCPFRAHRDVGGISDQAQE